jgi:hypothetical protein
MKINNLISGLLLLTGLMIIFESCTEYYDWQWNGINPSAEALVTTFNDTTLVYSNTLGNNLIFNVQNTLYFDPNCIYEIKWHFDELGSNMRVFLPLNATLPQSYQTDSTINITVSMDTDLSSVDEGYIYAEFEPNRMDTTTNSFTLYSRY